MDKDLEVYENPRKALNKLVIPILITSIIGSLNALVDTSFIGYLGANALSALGLLTPLYLLIMSFGSSIGVGTNVLMSRYIGNNNMKFANNIFNNSIFITLIIGSILTLIFILFNKQVLTLFGVSNQVYPFAADFSVVFYGSIIFLIQGIFSAIFRVELRSKLSTYCNIITIITNILFDYLFMFVFGWGMFGIGLGTLFSSLFVVVLMIFILYYYDDWIIDYKFNFKAFNLNNILKLFKITVPSFLESNVSTVFNIILNYLLLYVGGSLAVGIYTGSWRFIHIGFVVMGAYGASLTTICSMFYGRNDFKTIKELYLYSLKNTLLIGILLFLIFNLFGSYIALIVSHDSIVINGMTTTLGILSIFFIIMPFSTMAGSIFTSIDKPRVSLIVSLLKNLVFEVILMFLFVYLGFGVFGIYSGMIIGVAMGGILGAVLIYKYFKDTFDLDKLNNVHNLRDRSRLIREEIIEGSKNRAEIVKRLKNTSVNTRRENIKSKAGSRIDDIKDRRADRIQYIKDRHYFTLTENKYKFR